MRHKNKGRKLDRLKAPREAMLKNLASSVIIYEKIKTTDAKAKAVRPLLEKIITIAVKGGLNNRRELIRLLPQKMAIKKAVEVLAVKYKTRHGGYSRIIKLGTRPGDRANIVQLELV
ncbi:MAG: 50S ribosomal protein L17 [Patescibacteria group bacterium]|nr:50S ribosomal protein L17 [Patescibacteria group bacterium]